MPATDLSPSTVTRDQYAALDGRPLHRTYGLLQPAACCLQCGARLNATGYADWVRTDGLVITLWRCVNADCQAYRDATSFRLITTVVDEPAPAAHDCGNDPGCFRCYPPAPHASHRFVRRADGWLACAICERVPGECGGEPCRGLLDLGAPDQCDTCGALDEAECECLAHANALDLGTI